MFATKEQISTPKTKTNKQTKKKTKTKKPKETGAPITVVQSEHKYITSFPEIPKTFPEETLL